MATSPFSLQDDLKGKFIRGKGMKRSYLTAHTGRGNFLTGNAVETRPGLAMENWFGSKLARVDRRPLEQLYVAIKLDLSEVTFFLVPLSKQTL